MWMKFWNFSLSDARISRKVGVPQRFQPSSKYHPTRFALGLGSLKEGIERTQMERLPAVLLEHYKIQRMEAAPKQPRCCLWWIVKRYHYETARILGKEIHPEFDEPAPRRPQANFREEYAVINEDASLDEHVELEMSSERPTFQVKTLKTCASWKTKWSGVEQRKRRTRLLSILINWRMNSSDVKSGDDSTLRIRARFRLNGNQRCGQRIREIGVVSEETTWA